MHDAGTCLANRSLQRPTVDRSCVAAPVPRPRRQETSCLPPSFTGGGVRGGDRFDPYARQPSDELGCVDVAFGSGRPHMGDEGHREVLRETDQQPVRADASAVRERKRRLANCEDKRGPGRDLAILTAMHGERSAILVTSHPGQLTCAEFARAAAADERPRKDYVELARRLEADVIDSHWMQDRAAPIARLISQRIGMPAGQVAEGFLRSHRYRHLVAWADRIGLPLALLFKLARSRRDLVLMSIWLSPAKKAAFLRNLSVHSHVAAIVSRSVQAEIAASRLKVPWQKLRVEPRPVDDRFWRPIEAPLEPLVCAAGWEARDYPTLVRAMGGLDARLDLAVGSIALPEMAGESGAVDVAIKRLLDVGAPVDVRAGERRPRELRQLYARTRLVVVPLHDVDFDAGVTAVTEAMAMGKAVIASATRGLGDLFTDGQHGVFVPPGDVRALREAIAGLLDDPERAARLGRAGRALVQRRHRMDPCLDRLADIVRASSECRPARVAGPSL